MIKKFIKNTDIFMGLDWKAIAIVGQMPHGFYNHSAHMQQDLAYGLDPWLDELPVVSTLVFT